MLSFWKIKLNRTYTLLISHIWGLLGKAYTDVGSLNKALSYHTESIFITAEVQA